VTHEGIFIASSFVGITAGCKPIFLRLLCLQENSEIFPKLLVSAACFSCNHPYLNPSKLCSSATKTIEFFVCFQITYFHINPENSWIPTSGYSSWLFWDLHFHTSLMRRTTSGNLGAVKLSLLPSEYSPLGSPNDFSPPRVLLLCFYLFVSSGSDMLSCYILYSAATH
jgi:hypothetical protein